MPKKLTPEGKKHQELRALLVSSRNQVHWSDNLETALSLGDFSVSAIPFRTVHDVGVLLSSNVSKSRKVTDVKRLGDLVWATLAYNDKGKKEKGEFFILPHPSYPGVYAAATVDGNAFFRDQLLAFFSALYPRLAFTFVSHAKFIGIFEAFKARLQLTDLIVTRASHRLRMEKEDDSRKVVKSVSWLHSPLEKANAWLQENNGWFQSVNVLAQRGKNELAEISFSRQGAIQTNRMPKKIFELFLEPVYGLIDQSFNLFEHRARTENNLAVKPLVIDFGFELFDEVSENSRFIESMQTMPNSSVSVLHGNPYISLSVVDYFDGSMFDVWVLDPDKMIIVPQLRSSGEAVSRLVNHVFDGFAEGSIKDYIV